MMVSSVFLKKMQAENPSLLGPIMETVQLVDHQFSLNSTHLSHSVVDALNEVLLLDHHFSQQHPSQSQCGGCSQWGTFIGSSVQSAAPISVTVWWMLSMRYFYWIIISVNSTHLSHSVVDALNEVLLFDHQFSQQHPSQSQCGGCSQWGTFNFNISSVNSTPISVTVWWMLSMRYFYLIISLVSTASISVTVWWMLSMRYFYWIMSSVNSTHLSHSVVDALNEVLLFHHQFSQQHPSQSQCSGCSQWGTFIGSSVQSAAPIIIHHPSSSTSIIIHRHPNRQRHLVSTGLN